MCSGHEEHGNFEGYLLPFQAGMQAIIVEMPCVECIWVYGPYVTQGEVVLYSGNYNETLSNMIEMTRSMRDHSLFYSYALYL